MTAIFDPSWLLIGIGALVNVFMVYKLYSTTDPNEF